MDAKQRSYERVLISSVLDGFVLMPVLIALSDHGDIDKILSDGLDTRQVAGSRTRLDSAFFLLEGKGLVTRSGSLLRATDLGRVIFKRLGAFRTAFAYDIYMRDISNLLYNSDSTAHLDRAVNVRGAGAMNKKYFELVADYYRNTKAKYFLDIGCGDGTNLEFVLECNPELQVIGVDFEGPSLEATKKRFSTLKTKHPVLFFRGNVNNPEGIVAELKKSGIYPAEVMTSVWFIFHEVLGHERIVLSDLLSRYSALAKHTLVIGEIFAISPQFLAENGKGSGATTFLFLHYLSGQLPFSKEAWKKNISESSLTSLDFIAAEEMNSECRTGIWVLKG